MNFITTIHRILGTKFPALMQQKTQPAEKNSYFIGSDTELIKKHSQSVDKIIESFSHRLDELEQKLSFISSRQNDIFDMLLAKDATFLASLGNPKPLPLVKCKMELNGAWAFCSQQNNPALPKIVIATLPKSGTYFIGKILTELGYVDPEIHAADYHFDDYRLKTKDESLNFFTDFSYAMPLTMQIQLLQEGQFLVGHISYESVETLKRVGSFLVTIRDLREMFVSWLRFAAKRKPYSNSSWFDKGATEEGLYALMHSDDCVHLLECSRSAIAFFNNHPDHIVRFEDMMGDTEDGLKTAALRIASHTKTHEQDVLRAIASATNTRTKTYSGKRTTLEGIWSDRIEARFIELGCDVMNELLNYPRYWKSAT